MIVVTNHIVQHIRISTTSKNALDGLRTTGVPVVVASLPWRVAAWAICAIDVRTWNCVGLVAHIQNMLFQIHCGFLGVAAWELVTDVIK